MKPIIPAIIVVLIGVFFILLSFAVGEHPGDYHKYYFASSLLSGGMVAMGLGLMVLLFTFFISIKDKKKNNSQG